jgi:hypothetical protein
VQLLFEQLWREDRWLEIEAINPQNHRHIPLLALLPTTHIALQSQIKDTEQHLAAQPAITSQ